MTQKTVHAEMAGAILSVACTAGTSFTAGQELLVMESMKMEIPVLAGVSGKVREIRVQPGSAVHAGQRVVILDVQPFQELTHET